MTNDEIKKQHPKIKGFSIMIIRSGKHKDAILKFPYCCDDMKEINEACFKQDVAGEKHVIFHKDLDDDSSIEILKKLHEEDRIESLYKLKKDIGINKPENK